MSNQLQTVSRLYQGGDLSGAAEVCLQILRAEPQHVQALHFLGIIYHQLGRHHDAIGYLGQLARLAPANADVCCDLGAAYAATGRLAEAQAHYVEALRRRPDHAGAHNNLGAVFGEQGRFVEAMHHYRQSLQAKPDRASTHNNLGVALAEQGQLAEAEEHFRAAVRLQPGFPAAYTNWAGVLIELGRQAEAIHCCQEALRLDPDSVPAYAHLGELVVQGLYRFTSDQVARMENLVVAGSRSPGDGSRLHFILAALFDRQGEHDRAFSHYRQANDLKCQVFRQKNLAFDHDAHRRLIDNIIATFDKGFFERVNSFGLSTKVPVFVVGMPRTGSTLVAQILSSHPDIVSAGERQDLAQIVCSRSPYPEWMSGLDEGAARALAAEYIGRLSRFGPQAARIIDKMPHNYLHLGCIAALFPNAHIIHCRRDVMDVCLSCYFQNFSWVNYASRLEDLGFYYRQYERLMAHWREVLPLPIHAVNYEELVHDQERVSRDIVAFCGMDWSDRCLAFHENRRAVQTASKLQVRQPLYTGSIARWKRYEKHLSPLKQALAGEPVALTGSLAEPGPSDALDLVFASFVSGM